MMTNDAALRMAHALVCCSVACSDAVALRMPMAPLPTDNGEQLGLASPVFQDVPLQPVAVERIAKASVQLLVPADTLEQVLAVSDRASVQAALMQASAVFLEAEPMRISDLQRLDAGGAACLYRILLAPFSGSDLIV